MKYTILYGNNLKNKLILFAFFLSCYGPINHYSTYKALVEVPDRYDQTVVAFASGYALGHALNYTFNPSQDNENQTRFGYLHISKDKFAKKIFKLFPLVPRNTHGNYCILQRFSLRQVTQQEATQILHALENNLAHFARLPENESCSLIDKLSNR